MSEHCTAEQDKQYLCRRRIYAGISLALVLLLMGGLAWLIGDDLISIFSDPQGFREWVGENTLLAVAVTFGIMMLQVVILFIPCEMVEIAAGYGFGPWWGLLICLGGLATGSLIAFLLTRRFGVKLIEVFITREKIASMRFVKNAKRLDVLTFVMYLIPGSPKDAMAYVLAMTPMKPVTFLLISTIARIPSTLTSTLGGNALSNESYIWAIVIFGVTAIVALAGIFVYKKIASGRNK